MAQPVYQGGKVVIIGGGITGLAAAFHLREKAKEAGFSVDWLLLEREHRLGGKILTEQVDGFLLDGGPDCFVSEKPGVFELTRRVGLDDRLLGSNEERKGTFVLSRGRLHRLPEGLLLLVPTRIGPFLASPLISWPGKLRMALDLLIPKRRDGADESLESFVVRRLGREALDKIAEPLVAGIHAADPETMSVKASFPRFIMMEQNHGSLIRAMLSARKKAPALSTPASSGTLASPGTVGTPAPGPGRTFFMTYVRGVGELPSAIAARLDPERILLGAAVTRLEKAGEGYWVHVEGRAPVQADAVIVTLPAVPAAALLQPFDPELGGLLGRIPMTSTAVVNIAYRRADLDRPLEGFGFVVPHIEHRRIMACTYSSFKWNFRSPDEDSVLLRVFVGGSKNQELVRADEDKILRTVRAELRSILGITVAPRLARVHRWIDGMHQYTLGHLDRVAAIESLLPRHPGLSLAGGAYRGIGMSDCIRSGFAAAEQALAHLQTRADKINSTPGRVLSPELE